MNRENFKLMEKLLPHTYVQQAAGVAQTRDKLIQHLLRHRTWPEKGWDDTTIEMFLMQLSAIDSNNYLSNSSMGERESRIISDLVSKRHFRFGHGIGRSGDITEVQPKAAGSSLMLQLTNSMLHDVIKKMGVLSSVGSILLPVATGMAMMLCLLALHQKYPSKQFVLWSRIDQKACFKSIITAGLIPIIIDSILEGDELRTDIESIKEKINLIGANKILCIITTTSCFAPRAYDSVVEVSTLCATHNICHVINNAYGLQSTACMHQIQQSAKAGRVDVFIQSTDKNLLVPVGGSIISCFNQDLLNHIAKSYPGRASASPMIDVFITLLSVGQTGYMKLVKERKDMYKYLEEKLGLIATKYNERLLLTPHNPISIGMTLGSFKSEELTQIGSMLFLRNVSGTRVVTSLEIKEIEGHTFTGWGAHCSNYPTSYLTAAASIGIRQIDIDLFIKKIDKVLTKISIKK